MLLSTALRRGKFIHRPLTGLNNELMRLNKSIGQLTREFVGVQISNRMHRPDRLLLETLVEHDRSMLQNGELRATLRAARELVGA